MVGGGVEGCNVCTGVTVLVVLLTVVVDIREKHLTMAPPSPPKYAAVQIILANTTPTHISRISIPESIFVLIYVFFLGSSAYLTSFSWIYNLSLAAFSNTKLN